MSLAVSQSIEILRGLLPSVGQEFGVGRLWVAGSWARGEQRPDSDIDIVVEFERRGISLLGLCRLERELTDALGIRVDLVEYDALPNPIKVSVLQDRIPV